MLPPIKAIYARRRMNWKRIVMKEQRNSSVSEYTDELYARIDQLAHNDLNDALSIAKAPRQAASPGLQSVVDTLANEFADMDDAEKEKEIGNVFKELQRQIVRRRILTRITVLMAAGCAISAPLSAEVDVVPVCTASCASSAVRPRSWV